MKFVKSINESLHRILNQDSSVVFFGEDLDDPYGGAFKASKGLSTNFPNQVISTPISEAGIIGLSGGMAIGGLKPIVEIMFSDFILLGADQLLNHLVKYDWMYDNQVKTDVTIRTAIGGGRGYGPTHSQSIEPIIAAIPNIKIISPSHYHDPGEILEYCVLQETGIKIFCEYKMNYAQNLISRNDSVEGISFKRSGSNFPTVYLTNCNFNKPDLCIITHGGNTLLVEKLMTELMIEYELGINAVIPSIIKPLPIDDFRESVEGSETILILEESPKEFGWGSEVLAMLHEANLLNDKKALRVGGREQPIPSAIQMESRVLPSVEIIKSLLKKEIGI